MFYFFSFLSLIWKGQYYILQRDPMGALARYTLSSMSKCGRASPTLC